MSKKVLGLWNMGDDMFHPLLSPREGKNIIKEALKCGIDSFDSAFSYKNADSLLSSALREIGLERKDIQIISKVMPVPTLQKKVQISLKRLNTTYLDVLLLHWPTEEKALYSALKELEKLKEANIALEIGVSNFPLALLKKTSKDFSISIHERPLSLIWNKDWEEEKDLNLKTYAYSPLAMGLLSKTLTLPIRDSRQSLYIFKEGEKEFKTLRTKLENLSIKYNYSLAEIAYSWVYYNRPEAIIAGASKPEHLKLKERIMEDEDIKELSILASALNAKSPSDNIFSHQYLL